MSTILQRRGRRPAGLVAALLLAVWLGCGCNGSEKTWDEPGPATTFKRFLMHWFKNEQAEAFDMIRPEDRAVLMESLDFVEKELGKKVLKPHEMLVAGRVDNPYDLKDIEVEPKLETKPEPGRRVTLSLVYHDGRSGEAAMVWDGDRWYVDLPLESDAKSGAEPPDASDEETAADQTGASPEQPNSGRPRSDTSNSTDADSGENRE